MDEFYLSEEYLDTIVKLINATSDNKSYLTEDEMKNLEETRNKKIQERDDKIELLKKQFEDDRKKMIDAINDYKSVASVKQKLAQNRINAISYHMSLNNSYMSEIIDKANTASSNLEKERYNSAIILIQDESNKMDKELSSVNKELENIEYEFGKFLKKNSSQFNEKYKMAPNKKFDPNNIDEVKNISKEIDSMNKQLTVNENRPSKIKNDILTALNNKDYATAKNLLKSLKAMIPAYILLSVKDSNNLNSEINKLKSKIQELELEANAIHVDFVPRAEANERKRKLTSILDDNKSRVDKYKEEISEMKRLRGNSRIKNQLKELQKEKNALINKLKNISNQTQKDELEEKIEKISEQIDKINSIANTDISKNINNINKEIAKIELENKDITVEIAEIDAKIKNGEYLERESSKKDKEKLANYQQKLNSMILANEILDGKSLADLETNMYNNDKGNVNNKDENEEITEYKPAKISLIEKMKNQKFIKKAALTITAVGMAATIALSGMANFVSQHQKGNSAKKPTKTFEFNIDENNVDTLARGSIDAQSIKEENQNVKTNEDSLYNTVTDSISSVLNGEQIYSNVYDAYNQEHGLNAYAPSWESALENELDSVGKFYAIIDGIPREISFGEAEDYLQNGYQVITSVQNDDSTIGYMNLEAPAKSR